MAPIRSFSFWSLIATSITSTLASAIPEVNSAAIAVQAEKLPRASYGDYIDIPKRHDGSAAPLPPGFVAFSIEFAFFPDFAGNKSNPNTFSNNLLNNLRDLQGTKPYIRVGGNTQ